jgi:AraC-like DNA-binding protein
MTRRHTPVDHLLELLGSPVSIAGAYVESLLPAATALGLPTQALLEAAGISAERLAAPGYRLPLFNAFRLLQQAERHSQDPLIALRLGLAVRPRSFQVLGYAAMSCATLGEAIQRLQRFEALVWDIGEISLSEEGDRAVLAWRPRRLPWVPRQAVEMALAGWLAFGRWLSEGRALPTLIEFRHPLAAGEADYARSLGCPVQGNSERDAVVFPRALLQTPLREADPHLRALMDAQGEAALNADRLQGSLANEVRAALGAGLVHGEVSLARVAARLGLGPRALRRRLAEAGLHLPALLDELRQDLARYYLPRLELSLADIAYLLGFSEQSSFCRAVRRWTGRSAGELRRESASQVP